MNLRTSSRCAAFLSARAKGWPWPGRGGAERVNVSPDLRDPTTDLGKNRGGENMDL